MKFMLPMALLAFLTGCTGHKALRPPQVPASIQAPPGQRLARDLQGSGVQIYECRLGKNDPQDFEWTFVSPEAELRAQSGALVGHYYAGPTWEALDGSKVVGALQARADSPDPQSIPWLLLRGTSTSGHGVFSQTTSIQRINTQGGRAPASGCNAAQLGGKIRVPYHAEYLFYKLS